MLGSTPRIDKMTRPSKPNVDVEAVSVACCATTGVARTCFAFDMTAVEASTIDVAAPDAAMITREGWMLC